MTLGLLDTAVSDTAPVMRQDLTLPESGASASSDYRTFIPVEKAHYTLGREIARGGMGRILIARDRRLGRSVALKESLLDAGDAAIRFEREARITARLQHPSIVNVHEAGVWPTGEPFYAMRLVAGRSLDSVVSEARTLDARLALLPNVLAIADAIAYAHSERVIHRDLKPHNVLVGSFGETVVIDWGLAKELGDADHRGDRAACPGAGLETLEGEVMGTPAYMPPEQANGDAVDERADVYSIGAILYHVLSGAPPYTGRSGIAVLDTLREEPPVPLEQREPGVPRDLLAIVERAMARDPLVRYPTARELADDLRRYQTGQLVGTHRYSLGQLLRRWARRHRTALSVAGAAAVLMVVLGALAVDRILTAQERAESQRGLAVSSHASAEDLLEYMLVDLRDKLAPLGRLDLLGDVAGKARTYYNARTVDQQQSDHQRLALATMRVNVGDVLSSRGDVAGALVEFRAAMAIRQSLIMRYAHNRLQHRELALVHNRVGHALFAQGNTGGALEEHGRALAILRLLLASAPADVEVLREVALGHIHSGDVLRARDEAVAALAAYRDALTILEPLANRAPDDEQVQRSLSGAQEHVADLLLVGGDTEGALGLYRSSLSITESQLLADPRNAELQRDLSVSHNKLGDVLSVAGNAAAALVAYRASLSVIEPLVATDPTNAERRRDLAISHSNIGDMQVALDDTAGALASYRAALVLTEALAANDPTSADRQQDLALTQLSLGDAQRVRGDRKRAAEHYRAALSIHEVLASADPTNAHWQQEIATDKDLLDKVLVRTSRARR